MSTGRDDSRNNLMFNLQTTICLLVTVVVRSDHGSIQKLGLPCAPLPA